MDFSIVIVSYNAADFLRLTLHSVFAACNNVRAEVFVVDNNSQEDCSGVVANEFPECKLIANTTNPGFAIANNQAIKQAQGEFVLILNPDTVIAEDTLEKLLGFFRNTEKVGGVGIRMLDGSGEFLPESKRGIPSPWVSLCKMTGMSSLFPQSRLFNEYHKGYLNPNENNPVEILAGAFMVFPRKVLGEIGLLDEDFFMYGEDIDLSFRSIKAGYENYYFADSSIVHFKGESTLKDKVYVSRFYKAMIQFAGKHFSKAYGRLLKLLVLLGVYVVKLVSFFRLLVSRTEQKETTRDETVLLLEDCMPDENLMKSLRQKYKVRITRDLSNEEAGMVVFVLGKQSFRQMIETMDFCGDRFVYRFLDQQQGIMLGSDSKFVKGEVVVL